MKKFISCLKGLVCLSVFLTLFSVTVVVPVPAECDSLALLREKCWMKPAKPLSGAIGYC